MLDRRARHRRCRAADRARRCRRDGGGRHRVADQPHRAGGLRGLPRRCRPAYNDTPTKASRPYDKDRDGFVMGEGAGVVVLEELRARQARAARRSTPKSIGYGLSGDAYHITAPARGWRRRIPLHECGAQARRALSPAEIDYINAHGTSTHGRRRSSSARSSASSAMRLAGFRCRRPSRRSAICSVPPAPSRRSSAFSRSAIGSCRRRSTLDNPSVETAIDLVPHTATQARHERGADEFLRLWRNQCARWYFAGRRTESGLFSHQFCHIEL